MTEVGGGGPTRGRFVMVVATVFSLLGAAQSAAAQTVCAGGKATVSAEGMVFTLDSIPGWRFDCAPGQGDSVPLMIHRAGTSTATTEMIYAKVLPPSPASLSDRAGSDIHARFANIADLKASVGRVHTRSGQPAVVHTVSSESKGVFEMMAYIPRGGTIGVTAPVVVIGLKAPTRAALMDAGADFYRLIASYTAPRTGPGPR